MYYSSRSMKRVSGVPVCACAFVCLCCCACDVEDVTMDGALNMCIGTLFLVLRSGSKHIRGDLQRADSKAVREIGHPMRQLRFAYVGQRTLNPSIPSLASALASDD